MKQEKEAANKIKNHMLKLSGGTPGWLKNKKSKKGIHGIVRGY